MGTSELSRTLDEMLSGREGGGEESFDELASQKENLQYFNSLQATETR